MNAHAMSEHLSDQLKTDFPTPDDRWSETKLAASLDEGFAENVVPIKRITHDEALDHLADAHRTKAHNARQRMADIRRHMKAEAAAYKAEDLEADAHYKAEKAERAALAAASKATDELLLAGEKRLASYNQKAERAALDALAE